VGNTGGTSGERTAYDAAQKESNYKRFRAGAAFPEIFNGARLFLCLRGKHFSSENNIEFA
jgi:hypothetical protein